MLKAGVVDPAKVVKKALSPCSIDRWHRPSLRGVDRKRSRRRRKELTGFKIFITTESTEDTEAR